MSTVPIHSPPKYQSSLMLYISEVIILIGLLTTTNKIINDINPGHHIVALIGIVLTFIGVSMYIKASSNIKN